MTHEFQECEAIDRGLLERAADHGQGSTLHELSENILRDISADEGIDFATALLYQRVIESEEHGQSFDASNHFRDVQIPEAPMRSITLAIVPGAFYEEYPETGADGSKIREAAESLGCQTELIETKSVGTLKENAEKIIAWLLQNRGKRILLASLSKGGADIKVALEHKSASEAFQDVVAWINIGGITSGSPLVTWVLSGRVTTLMVRVLFWWRRRNFQFFEDLDRRPGKPLDFPLRVPRHLRVFHVVGFPLKHHLSTRHSRKWHRRLLEYGPNDAATVLFDSCTLPGVVFPIWGADHYSATRVNWTELTRSVLLYLESDLSSPEQNEVLNRISLGVEQAS